jgi:hypothetical protein
MKFKIYTTNEEPVTSVALIERDGCVYLAEVDQDGDAKPGGYVCRLSSEGLKLAYGYRGAMKRLDSGHVRVSED